MFSKQFLHIYIFIYLTIIVQMEIICVHKKMSAVCFFLLVQKCLCVSISRGKPSIYSLLNIGYVVYVVYVAHFLNVSILLSFVSGGDHPKGVILAS